MEWVGTMLSAASLIVAAVTFLINFHRTKRVETICAIDDLYELYYELDLGKKKTETDYPDFVKYMSKVDRFAAGVNSRVYARRIVKNQAGAFLIRQYEWFMKDIIQKRRSQFKRETYYQNIEEMVNIFNS